MRKGALVRNPNTGNFSVRWGEQVALTTKTSRQNRSMELSELVRFKHLYLAMCDYTGTAVQSCLQPHHNYDGCCQYTADAARFAFAMAPLLADTAGLVFKVMPADGTVFQRYAVADGDGDFSKPFKAC